MERIEQLCENRDPHLRERVGIPLESPITDDEICRAAALIPLRSVSIDFDDSDVGILLARHDPAALQEVMKKLEKSGIDSASKIRSLGEACALIYMLVHQTKRHHCDMSLKEKYPISIGPRVTIYLAEDESKNHFIVKKFPYEQAMEEEIRLVLRLEELNLGPAFHSSGTCDTAFYYAVNFVPGVTLKNFWDGFLNDKSRNWAILRKVLERCGTAVSALVSGGLCHHSLTDDHVYLAQDGRTFFMGLGSIRACPPGTKRESVMANMFHRLTQSLGQVNQYVDQTDFTVLVHNSLLRGSQTTGV